MVFVHQIRTGFQIMAGGFGLFCLGVWTLGLMTPEDPHWLVMMLVVFTWANVFVVMAGFTFLAKPFIRRRVREHFDLPKTDE